MGTYLSDIPADEVRETHISWVFLSGPDVWKIKKPVDMGFLDFTRLDARERACHEEVRLNSRLAPHIYRGVVPVTRDASGHHRIGGDGTVVDHAVHMRRLRDEDRADVLLETGKLGRGAVHALAAQLVRFHEAALRGPEVSQHGEPDAVAHNVRENFAQTRDHVTDHISAADAREIEDWQTTFIGRHKHLFLERIAKGRVCDGHGDLRLEHVYLTPGSERATIIDCIEFNDRFRCADVCADVAFLSMDLAWHGRRDLAEALLARYAREANDFELFRLVDFYEGYRAYVRAKIATFVANNEDMPGPVRERAAEEARRYYLLAMADERRFLVGPAVVAVGGLIASGKSTLAEAIAPKLEAPVVDTDRTRKFLAGVPATKNISTGTWTGAYAPEFTDDVYREVLHRADAVLTSGRTVILDASFRTRAMREEARSLARRHGVPFFFVECRVPAEVAKERLRKREGEPGVVSDGRLEIFDDFAASWEAPDEIEDAGKVRLDTSRPVDENLSIVGNHLPVWPAGLTG